ncbi:MAG: hypothetical protein JO261_04620, partial [Alphaproteobacteria bacterium]|nr:hypothetical protein [Alphaproteobacteria bacterium]
SVLIVNGHPDPRPERFCAAVAEAYRNGVRNTGGKAEVLSIGAVKGESGWTDAADRVRDSTEFMVVFPLWLDGPPPLLANLVAQAAPQRCHDAVVTMALPAFAHRSSAVHPELVPLGEIRRATFIGSVEALSLKQRKEWLAKIEKLPLAP